MKAVVTGGRGFHDWPLFCRALEDACKTNAIHRMATGDATGADSMAVSWARMYGVDCCIYKANWSKFGKSAGPRRNRSMLETEQPDLVIAFPGGAGTADCVRQAKAMGLKVIEVTP